MLKTLISFLFLCSLSYTSVVTSDISKIPHVVHEQRGHVPLRWVKRNRMAATARLSMRVGLKQNLDGAHDHLMDVSDPDSPNYGKFWTQQRVIDTFQPPAETVAAVKSWLVDAGITSKRITHSDNKGWLAFDATTAEAEKLLQTEYHEFEDRLTSIRIPSCESYRVPANIRRHIDYITPGTKLLALDSHTGKRKRTLHQARIKTRAVKEQNIQPHQPKFQIPDPERQSSNSNDLSICDVYITPACIAALYQIPEPASLNVSDNNSLGIFSTNLNHYRQEDLDLFFANLTDGRIPNGTHPIPANIDGGVQTAPNLTSAGVEAELDLLLAYPIVYPQKITFYNVDDLLEQDEGIGTDDGLFNTFLDALDGSYCTYSAYGETGNDPDLDPVYPDPRPGGYKGPLQCGTYKPTNVISISYGSREADIPVAYHKRQCDEYLKLGLQGVSILWASGDSGVSERGCLGPQLNIFSPTWPNSCPYVLSVGGTEVYPGKSVFEPESAMYKSGSVEWDLAGLPISSEISSGGGFSNVYPVPGYQKTAVTKFFADHNPPYPYYSALANQSYDIHDVHSKPNVTAFAGSTGGIYNRIGRGVPDVAANGHNIALFVKGEFRQVGGTSASAPIFASVINRIIEERIKIGKGPLGFLNPAMYKNPGMFNDIKNGSNPGCNTQGFSAVEGWDPVTGLGTPNYPKMLDYFLGLP
ncbi:MAG: hypothetical protein M1820_001318 [Bogoriella megaspora]|nr:MAG: hypothetical protein M1820_001318 [Bogoriella megaspora]